jgi:hypothetical protein
MSAQTSIEAHKNQSTLNTVAGRIDPTRGLIILVARLKFIATYAGFEGESELLMDLYKKAVDRDEHPEGAVRIHPTLPIYENREARIFCYWDRSESSFISAET